MMADGKDKSYETLERSFVEFSKQVSKSLETIGKELDSIHKRMADGEAASVRTSADLGMFKELVRDDLESLDGRVDDALFTPSHYGPTGDGGTVAAYTVRTVSDGAGGRAAEIYLPEGCLVVAGTEVDVAEATRLEGGSEQDWYKLGFDEGPVYLYVTSRHSDDMTSQANNGEINPSADTIDGHYDRVTSVEDGEVEVEFSDTPRESAEEPDDCDGWMDCVKICELLVEDDAVRVAQVTLGTLVLHGPPSEPMLAFPVDRWDQYDNGVQRVVSSDPMETTAGELLHFHRAPDGCVGFSAPLQVKASGSVTARLHPSSTPGVPSILNIVGMGIDSDDLRDMIEDLFGSDSESGVGVVSLIGNTNMSQEIAGRVDVDTESDANVKITTTGGAGLDTTNHMKIGVYYL